VAQAAQQFFRLAVLAELGDDELALGLEALLQLQRLERLRSLGRGGGGGRQGR
jgi:hypothetical protein